MLATMRARYAHTNVIARDWQALARFYEQVFGCVRVPPERDLAGAWLARGTGVADAHLVGVHLRLPGHGPDGPTLEIFSYASSVEQTDPVANRHGLAHLAFGVDDVAAAVAEVVAHGGFAGEVVSEHVPGVGRLEFAYVRDPERNLIELQRWS